MIRRTILITTLAMAVQPAAAQEFRLLTHAELSPVIKKYASSIGCSVDDMDVGKKNIARIDLPELGFDGSGTYVAAVYADFGCAGGSGTSWDRLVVLWTGERPQDDIPYVIPEASEPTARATGSPKTITSLYVKNGQLYATGLTYGENDSNCCPSVRAVYRVDLSYKEVPDEEHPRRAYDWRFVRTGTY